MYNALAALQRNMWDSKNPCTVFISIISTYIQLDHYKYLKHKYFEYQGYVEESWNVIYSHIFEYYCPF